MSRYTQCAIHHNTETFLATMHSRETVLVDSPIHLLTIPGNCAGGTLGSIKCRGGRLLPKEHIPDNIPEAPAWSRQCREEPQGAESSIAHALRKSHKDASESQVSVMISDTISCQSILYSIEDVCNLLGEPPRLELLWHACLTCLMEGHISAMFWT